MAATPSVSEIIANIEQLQTDMGLFHRLTHGTDSEYVPLGGILRPTVANLWKTLDLRESKAAQLVINGAAAQINNATQTGINQIQGVTNTVKMLVSEEGDAQVERIQQHGDAVVAAATAQAVSSAASAAESKQWAQNAQAVSGIRLADPENNLAGYVLPRNGFQYNKDTGELSVIQATVVSSPALDFPSICAIGHSYTLSMSAVTAVPGATVAGFRVRVDNGVETEIPAVNQAATLSILIDGLDFDTGSISVVAIDTLGNHSQAQPRSFIKRAVNIRAPRIVSPVNGEVDVLLNPAIVVQSWSVLSFTDTPDKTDIIVYDRDPTDPDAEVVTQYSGEYTTEWTLEQTLELVTHYYVKARHHGSFFGWSDWGVTASFKTTDAYISEPVLSGIVDGDIDTALRPTISVGPFAVVPIGFDVPATTDNFEYSFTTLGGVVLESGFKTFSGIGGTITPANNLPTSTTIIFSGKWVGDALTSAATEIQFTTVNAYIAAPVFGGVSDGTVGVALRPAITVGAFEVSPIGFDTPKLTDSFHYIFRTASDGSMLEEGYRTLSASGGTVQPTNNLPLFTSIRFEGNWVGNILESSAGSLNFETVNAFTHTPSITLPAMNAVGVALRPNITVSARTNTGPTDTGKKTQIQLSVSPTFDSIAVEYNAGYTTSFTPPTDLALNTKYYARARHEGNLWGWSEWSNTVAFTTLNATLAVPSITAPSNGSVQGTQQPTVSIGAPAVVGQTITYIQIQVSTSSSFGSITWDTGQTRAYTTSLAVGTALSKGSTYYVRARVYGSVTGWTNWSSTVSFSIAAVISGDVWTLTSSQTWYAPTAGRYDVEVVGGGGGCGAGRWGGPQAYYVNSGAGGGYAKKTVTLSSGQATAVTIGAGGAGSGGPTNYYTDGGPGGTSSFGSHCSATGGEGGLGSGDVWDSYLTPIAKGGTGVGGTVNSKGGNGMYAYNADPQRAPGGTGFLGYGTGGSPRLPWTDPGIAGVCKITYLGA